MCLRFPITIPTLCMIISILSGINSFETLTIYTRETLSDTTVNRINAYQDITSATKNMELTINGFQNVFDIPDLSGFGLELTVVSRRSRHVGFCLLKKGGKNPLTTAIGEKFKLDFWKVDCDVIDSLSTLQLSNLILMKKEEGSL